MVNYVPAEQNNDSVAFGWDETKHKNVLATTVVALGGGLSKRAFGMQNNFLVLGANEVVDDVRSGRVSARITEPLGANKTFHDRCWRVDSAVTVK